VIENHVLTLTNNWLRLEVSGGKFEIYLSTFTIRNVKVDISRSLSRSQSWVSNKKSTLLLVLRELETPPCTKIGLLDQEFLATSSWIQRYPRAVNR
jgi:hypothetical protein